MDKNDVFKFKEEGDSAFQQGDFSKAVASYDACIALRPQFWGAHHFKAQALSQLNKPLEAAAAYWQAYLFSNFDKKMAIMAARALSDAKLYVEACDTFELFSIDVLDNETLVYYLWSLRQQGRAREAYRLIPRLGLNKSIYANIVIAYILIDLNLTTEAFELLPIFEAAPYNDYIADILFCFYSMRKESNKAKSALDTMITNSVDPAYSACLRIALDIIEEKNQTPINAYRSLQYFRLIDSANYLAKHKAIYYTATTFETFDFLAPQVMTQGLVLEFGVRFGCTISRLSELFPDREIYGFDSFQGLPEAWAGEEKGSYTTLNRLPEVSDNVTLVKGWFNDTLPAFKKEHPDPIAFMNMDADLYSSTKDVLDSLKDQIIKGTIIVFDEYIINQTWREDEYKAFQEWVVENKVVYQYVAASMTTKQVAVIITQKG